MSDEERVLAAIAVVAAKDDNGTWRERRDRVLAAADAGQLRWLEEFVGWFDFEEDGVE